MTGNSATRSMLALCTIILSAAALYLARSILAPVEFSIFAMTVVWPFQRTLQARMPKLLALLLTLLLTLFVLGVLALSIAWGSSQVGQWLFRNVDRFQFIYARTNEWLEGHGIFASATLADRLDVSWLAHFAQDVAAGLNSMVGFVLLVFAFTILGLMEVEHAQSRISKLESEYPHLQLSQASKRITTQFQKYIFIRSLASILTGFVTFLFAVVVGLELAFAWGVIAFVFNLIPFLGPVAAVVLTTLFAAAQFETLQMTLVVLAGLSVIHFWIGSYIEPLLAGATLAISPFLVLFAVFFWSFSGAFPAPSSACRPRLR
jgi:predicted PurR-regulated permease PerM